MSLKENLRSRRGGTGWRVLRDYAVWQPAIHLAGIAAGLLFVNFMTTPEYALYTLASSAMSLLILICDLGITDSLPYFRREAHIRNISFESYLRASGWLRRVLLAVGAPVFLVIFSVLAFRNGFGARQTCAAALIVIVAVWFQTRAAITLISLRLRGDFRRAYRAELAAALVRLGVTAIMAVSSAMYALLALSANALGSLVAVKAGEDEGEPAHTARPSVSTETARREIIRYILPGLPSVVYFAFQGILVTFLSAIFGHAKNVAEVGALGRLGLIVGLLVGVIPGIIVPRLSGVVSERLYWRQYVGYGLLLGLGGIVLCVCAYVWPEVFLAVLGSQYRDLESELMLTVAAASVGLVGAYCVAINQARAWVRRQPAAVGVFAATQVILIGALPLSTTGGVLLFNLLSGMVGTLLQFGINVVGFWRPAWVALGRSSLFGPGGDG